MPRPPKSPCSKQRTYYFELSDGRVVIITAVEESEAARTIPVIFGKDILWAIAQASRKKYTF